MVASDRYPEATDKKIVELCTNNIVSTRTVFIIYQDSLTLGRLYLQSPRSLSPEKIKAVLGDDHTESNEETYDIYLLPPGEDPEACQSYLRMRNREGKYNLMFEVYQFYVFSLLSMEVQFYVFPLLSMEFQFYVFFFSCNGISVSCLMDVYYILKDIVGCTWF